MKAKMAFLRVLVLILTFTALASQPPFARAADATSFDPTLVEVTAKSVSGYPIGFIAICPVAKCPEEDELTSDGHPKWLECNGQAINPTVYPELAASYGPRVPDFRGLFLRGHGSQVHSQENGSTVGITPTLHESGALGQVQGDAIRNITGAVRNANSFLGYRSYNVTAEGALSFEQNSLANVGNGNNSSLKVTGYTMNASRSVPTGNENRPANMAVRYLVRALN